MGVCMEGFNIVRYVLFLDLMRACVYDGEKGGLRMDI